MAVEKDFKDLKKFVCVLYGKQRLNIVDEVRYIMFHGQYRSKDDKQSLQNINGFNAGGLPTCQSVLKQKILCSNFIASI